MKAPAGHVPTERNPGRHLPAPGNRRNPGRRAACVMMSGRYESDGGHRRASRSMRLAGSPPRRYSRMLYLIAKATSFIAGTSRRRRGAAPVRSQGHWTHRL
jgi:hypothetical protein